MSSDNPFFLSKIECPICKTINEFETVRVGAYTEGNRDSDFCPRDILWRYPKYEAYNPLAFFTVTCSNCYYTREFVNKFKDWKKDTTFRTYRLKVIKEKHLEILATSESVIKRLGDAVDLHNHPNESAIIKLHLAVLDESFNEHASQLDLGRFYLRIGWVFRYLNTTERPQVSEARGLVLDVEKKYEQIQNALAAVRDSVNEFDTSMRTQFDSAELSADMQGQLLPFNEKFKLATTDLSKDLNDSNEKIKNLWQLIGEYRNVALGQDSGDGNGFGKYASFADFLFEMAELWDGVACNEKSALQRSIYHYKEAFTNGKDISAGNPQIQAAYLIAELSRRVGDHDNAKQYFNTTIKLGQEFIYENRRDQSRTALARKILELAIEQGRANLSNAKTS